MTNLQHDLYTTALRFWQDYLQRGPGKFSSEDLTDFQTAKANWEASQPDKALLRACSELDDLFHRCVHRSEGLSFVTGEAGLIPRIDLHHRCETLLGLLEPRKK